MTSRVEELLIQLEQIDYKNSPTQSISNRSSILIRDTPTMKRPTPKISTPLMSDNTLKSDLQDLQVQLKVIAVQKKKEKISMAKQCDKIDSQIQGHREEMQKIEKNLGSLESKAENVEKIIKEKQDEKLEAFRYALKPLEDTANTILEEKDNLIKKNEMFSLRMNELEEIRNSKSEELKQLLAQRNEYSQNREKLQKSLAEIKDSDPCNYKEYIQEIETREILAAIKNRKSKQTAALKELEKKLAEIEVQIEKSTETSQTHQVSDSFVPISIEKEIEDIENYLNMLCKDLSIPTLQSFIREHYKKKAFPIEEMFVKEQYSLVEDKQMHIEENWKRQKEHMESKIIEMRRATEDQEVEIYALISNETPNPHLEIALQDMQKSLDNMRKEAERAHRVHSAKIAAIEKWKVQNRAALLIDENAKAPEDSEIIKAFKRELQKNVPKLEQWKIIENVVNRYFEKLNDRNNNFQEFQAKENERVQSLNQKNSVLKELYAIKNSLLAERDSLHKEFLKIITLEKAAVKKFENTKIEIDKERNRQIEKVTDENLQNNKSGLLQIQKTYGDKAIKKIREKEIQTVKESHEKLRESVKKKLDGLSSDISHWESLIQKIDLSINETLKPEIYLIDQETVRIKQELALIAQQLQIIQEAESEVNAKLEYLMDSKKRDIHRSLHRTLEIHGGDVDTKKIHRLVLIRDKKESVISQLTQEKAKIEKEFEEKAKNLDLEEVRVKAKIVQIEENIETMKKSRIENIERQATTIEHDVLDEDIPDIIVPENEPVADSKEQTISSSSSEIDEEIHEEFKKEDTEISHEATEVSSKIESGINIDFSDLSAQENLFFQSILPLLTGTSLYKKLSQRNSLLVNEYDPIDSENPEAFGYGLRNFKLNKSLVKIEVRQLNKPGIESSIMVEHLLAPIIPKHTSEMIKAQKKNWLNEQFILEVDSTVIKRYQRMKTSGLMDYTSMTFKIISQEANNYPFFIALEKGGRIEVVATGYSVFKQWIDGINALIKFKKQIGRLKYKIN